MKVAVIGSGMAGLTAARIFDTAGVQVTVFDKSKGTGADFPAAPSKVAGSIMVRPISPPSDLAFRSSCGIIFPPKACSPGSHTSWARWEQMNNPI
jgi:cation diffusion facilitator CzcD-associated flavoprotein CzcO